MLVHCGCFGHFPLYDPLCCLTVYVGVVLPFYSSRVAASLLELDMVTWVPTTLPITLTVTARKKIVFYRRPAGVCYVEKQPMIGFLVKEL